MIFKVVQIQGEHKKVYVIDENCEASKKEKYFFGLKL